MRNTMFRQDLEYTAPFELVNTEALYCQLLHGIPEMSCPPKLAASKATPPILHTR